MAKITVTGLDEKTDISAVKSIKDKYGSMVEFGILYSAMSGSYRRHPRYEWAAEALREIGGQCALHVCGGIARQQLINHDLHGLVSCVNRVQVNGVLTPAEVMACADPLFTLITQHCIGNESLLQSTGIQHSILVDASSGRGILPDSWIRPETEKAVGFAGGLSPDNLAEQLATISAIAKDEWWVDMEGGLRVDDWFSTSLAEESVAIFHEFHSALKSA